MSKFKFSNDQLKDFTDFLRSVKPLVLVNWPRPENRPKYPGMPGYKLLGVFEDYEEEATTCIHAIFYDQVTVPGLGSGDAIWLKSCLGIDQVFISDYKPENILKYLSHIKSVEKQGL